MTKKTKTEEDKEIDKPIDPQGAERFTVILKDAYFYGLLSVHEFDGVKYRVDATMAHKDGTAVEFVRIV